MCMKPFHTHTHLYTHIPRHFLNNFNLFYFRARIHLHKWMFDMGIIIFFPHITHTHTHVKKDEWNEGGNTLLFNNKCNVLHL